MDREQVTRTIVETTVERCIREMQTDPNRSIRKLVDMGHQFSNGRFQKHFFEMAQKMLRDEKSPYYTLVRNIIAKADHETIKTFGVNIGLNGLTKGAKIIREREASTGRNIPWSVTFHPGSPDEYLTASKMEDVISQGKKIGIFTYMICADAGEPDLLSLLELMRQEPDCAFLLFVEPAVINGANAQKIAECHNLMICVDTDAYGWEEAAQSLERCGCLFGLHRKYADKADAQEITSGAWVRNILRHPCVFAFCFAARGCPHKACETVQRFALSARTDQQYPVILIDYYADDLLIDQIISDGPCFVGILPDGTVTACDGFCEKATPLRIQNRSLKEILGIQGEDP